MGFAFTTSRLHFEPSRRAHAAELAPCLCDPRVHAFFAGPVPTIGDLELQFATSEAGPPPERAGEVWLDFVVRLATNQAIGRVEALVAEGRAEVAYLFGPAHWGCGYATESLAWLHGACARLHGAAEFWATVHPANRRSLSVLGRAGYAEAPLETWPRLGSYDDGDLVFRRAAGSA